MKKILISLVCLILPVLLYGQNNGNIQFADEITKSLCVTSWDTNGDGELSYNEAAAVTSLGDVFRESTITSFDELQYFTGLTEIITQAFSNCMNLQTITLPSTITAIGQGAFVMCDNLQVIDIPASVANIGDGAFWECMNLAEIRCHVINPFPIQEQVFFQPTYEKATLHVPQGSGQLYRNTEFWSNFANIIDDLTEQNQSDPEPYAVLSNNNTVLTFYYDENKATRNGMGVGPFTYTDETNTVNSGWNQQRESITNVVFDASFANCTSLTSTAYWFYECFNLTSITGINNLKTDNVTDMEYMFAYCSGLTNLDVTGFNTQNVTDMSSMFRRCYGLTNLNVSGFNTQKVTDMGLMFNGCSGLTSLDVTGFNTQNVTSMRNLFENCSSLSSINVTGFNTQNVTDMYGMFGRCSSLTSLDVSNFNTAKVIYMGNMFYYCSGLTSLDVSGFNTSNVTDMSWMFSGCSGLTSLDVSGFNTEKVTDMGGLFEHCSSLTNIDVSRFKTDNVTDMDEMFEGCSGLTILDVSALNTGNVTSMEYMFGNCTGLTSLDLTAFNTSKVKNMSNMFRESTRLTSINLSKFNTSNVTVMEYMFNNCSSMKTIDLSSFNTAKVEDMDGMFKDCSALTTIYVGSDWTTSEKINSYEMFTGCTNLVGGAGTRYSQNHINIAYAHIDGGTANPGYMTASGAEPWKESEPYAVLSDNNTVLTFYYDGNRSAFRESMNVGTFNSMESRGWYEHADDITSVVFDSSFSAYTTLTSTNWWFTKMTNLTSISGLENLNTQNVTSMFCMFWDCEKLTSLDLSHFNTTKVTDFQRMFQGCYKLEKLNLSNINTTSALDMSYMFLSCSSLTTLDLSSFNTSNVTDMLEMFKGYINLKTIYVGNNWATSAVTSGDNMFEECPSLIGGAGTRFDENHVDVAYAHIDGGTANPGYFTASGAEPWNEPNESEPYAVLSDNNTVLTFYYDENKQQRNGMDVRPFGWVGSGDNSHINSGWYEQRESITNVVFDESFSNYTSLESTNYWFWGCVNLMTITGISNLKTNNVKNMISMFANCSKLTSLDLTGFNTQNVTNMSSMFENCSSLTSIDVNNFKTEHVTTMELMFSNCSSLISLDVSKFNTENLTDMFGMFRGCSSLTSLDVSGFKTDNVQRMTWMFISCNSLASIQAGSASIPAEQYAEIGNPNLLVYVNEASLAPQGVQNVVINGQAKEIILTDAESGYGNWYCPQTFTAEKISYTREFKQNTEVGISRGWESIALPFNVQTITHENQGQIIPFTAQGNGKKFWLRGYSPDGLYSAPAIEANTPYLISMPNNTVVYPDEYNLNGRVTFTASNTTVPATPKQEEMIILRGNIAMMPNFQYIPQNEYVYAINVGQPRDNYAEGSVFARGLRDIRPFEAYTSHAEVNGARPNYIRIGAQPRNETMGIKDIELDYGEGSWYDLNGRKLSAEPKAKGVYIHNGKKTVVR